MAANTAKDETTVVLMDGTKVVARPLKISLLRPFMKKFAEVEAVAQDNEKSMDILVDCVQIALQQYKPDLAEDKKALEEILDLPTVYKIVEVASGVNLRDAELLNM
jgi:hypothetical protein